MLGTNEQPAVDLPVLETEFAKILICYHKPSEILHSNYLCPIQAGREASQVILENMIGDNTGDHISSKNPNYCELTTIYWAWKNMSADYYGLMHYRRIFDFTEKYPAKTCYRFDRITRRLLGLSDQAMKTVLQDHDMVLPLSHSVSQLIPSGTVRSEYCQTQIASDLHHLRSAIESKAPHTLLDFDAVFSGEEAYFYNMFIMRKSLFLDYSKWLFSILFELEQHLDFVQRNDYQKRVFGFLGERLLSVYVHHCKRTQSIRIKELPVVLVSGERPKLAHSLRMARRRYAKLKIGKKGIHLRLFNWEFHRSRSNTPD